MGEEPKRTPLFSTRADDPAMQETLDAFAMGLSERIDGLQDAEIGTDLAKMAALASELEGTAAQLGYGPLAECAAHVKAACSRDDPQAARKGLVDLTELAQRVRLGHRGAA